MVKVGNCQKVSGSLTHITRETIHCFILETDGFIRWIEMALDGKILYYYNYGELAL